MNVGWFEKQHHGTKIMVEYTCYRCKAQALAYMTAQYDVEDNEQCHTMPLGWSVQQGRLLCPHCSEEYWKFLDVAILDIHNNDIVSSERYRTHKTYAYYYPEKVNALREQQRIETEERLRKFHERTVLGEKTVEEDE